MAKHPLRERLVACLMTALYRSGRQAEALASYRHARRTLVDELGIEPAVSLQELEQAILRQDPALESAPTSRSSIGTDANGRFSLPSQTRRASTGSSP